MKLITWLFKITFISLLLLMSSLSRAAEQFSTGTDNYLWLTIGFTLGIVVSSMFQLYRNKKTLKKYRKLKKRFEGSLQESAQAELALQALAKEQQQSQGLLEERVQERTLELHIALQELEEANQELERKNLLDELTSLYNRRSYDQKILAEYRRCKRNLTPLSLVVLDIDYFKKVNDNYGHLAGDQCLIWLSSLINQCLKRSSDLAFRYGGEEFCLILPDTDAQGAVNLAEGLRERVAAHPFHFEHFEIPLTISCGVSTYQQQAEVDPEDIFVGADRALYLAKNNGRNQTKQHQFGLSIARSC